MPCSLNILSLNSKSLDGDYWVIHIYSVPAFWIAGVRI